MRAFARNTRNIFLAVILTTFLTAAPSGTPNFIAKFDNAGNPTADSIISDNGTNIGIGTTTPSAKLNVDPKGPGGIVVGDPNTGSGGFTSLLMDISGARDGFGRIQAIKSSGSAWGDIALNPLGGNVGIGTTNPQKKLHIVTQPSDRQIRLEDSAGFWEFWAGGNFHVTEDGTADRLLIQGNSGNVGIGTNFPAQKLDVAGTIRSSSGGFMFPDGTTQTTATLRGPQGPQGPAGPPGPPTKSVAVCSPTGGAFGCICNKREVTRQIGRCTVSSETGSCFSGEPNGCCAVCAP